MVFAEESLAAYECVAASNKRAFLYQVGIFERYSVVVFEINNLQCWFEGNRFPLSRLGFQVVLELEISSLFCRVVVMKSKKWGWQQEELQRIFIDVYKKLFENLWESRQTYYSYSYPNICILARIQRPPTDAWWTNLIQTWISQITRTDPFFVHPPSDDDETPGPTTK